MLSTGLHESAVCVCIARVYLCFFWLESDVLSHTSNPFFGGVNGDLPEFPPSSWYIEAEYPQFWLLVVLVRLQGCSVFRLADVTWFNFETESGNTVGRMHHSLILAHTAVVRASEFDLTKPDYPGWHRYGFGSRYVCKVRLTQCGKQNYPGLELYVWDEDVVKRLFDGQVSLLGRMK